MSAKEREPMPLATSNENVVRFQDDISTHEKVDNKHSQASSEEDGGFIARQKRRISENPKITQIQLARHTSKHNISFLRKSISILVNSTFWKILFAVLRLIPVSKVVMYGAYFNQCQAEPFIPIYLLIGGLAACIRDLANLFAKFCLNEKCLMESEVACTLLSFSYTVTEFGWFIVGSVYVYKTYNNFQSVTHDADDYCNSVLYMYSFGVTTLSYALLILVFTLSCCTLLLASYSETPKSSRSSKPDIYQ